MKCPFCRFKKRENNLIFESDHFILFKDNRPLIKEHSLLIPKKHIRSEIEIPKDQWAEYMSVSKRAYHYVAKKYGKAPLIFINAPQDQSVKHFHKHFVPGVFGILGVDKALRNFTDKVK